MKRLLHVCCANCLSDVAGALTEDGPGGERTELVLLYSNPNIHPLVEFRKRRKSVRLLAGRLGLGLEEDPYALHGFLERLSSSLGGRFGREDGRCRVCYEMRLRRAAEVAREHGCDAFTTTLLTSHHQDGRLLREVGEAVGASEGVRFEALELEHLFGTDSARPKDLKLHKQSYCGCVFSEEERFR